MLFVSTAISTPVTAWVVPELPKVAIQGNLERNRAIQESLEATQANPKCSCMAYLWTRGVKLKGDAKDLIPNTDHATRGIVVQMRYDDIYHAAYIENVYPTYMEISEWNYKKCEYTRRFIGKNNEHIIGYVLPL